MSFEIPQGQEKYDYVQSKFTEIAQKYDVFNDLITQGFHRYWKNYVCAQAALKPGDQALDICCGTGDITERLGQAVGPQGKVVGLDFSFGMLQVAKSRDLKSQRVYLQGDAMKLPIASEKFDAVTVGFGLRNLVRIEDCMAEVLRVLKPGGRFVVLDMGKVKIPVAKQVFRAYFHSVVPLVGKFLYPGQDMFDYFPASAENYPSQEKLGEMLQGQGFEQVRFKNFHLGSTSVHVAFKPA
ncbi:MAG: bifunctional demethylmenaquinone methyltransferase/2-methoxy-6-polyprenyl-1,4-benzoquinol methylase UbiE [bacterium]|nr:bifunctional demethylmenaquinone methyltransferase/2-methoxy-6-polyprenyl-1,4-benzoquinol methylase UbiE [bacterium]